VVTSCTYPVREGLVVETDTDKIHRLRKGLLELYLAQAPASEVIRELAAQYGVTDTPYHVRDPEEKCILCGLCERVCRQVRGEAAISFAYRGIDRRVIPPFDESLDDCLGCGPRFLWPNAESAGSLLRRCQGLSRRPQSWPLTSSSF